MKKNEKFLSSKLKKDLQFLIEGFLEKTEDEILGGNDQIQAREIFETLQSILSKSPEWDEAPDASDRSNTDFTRLVHNCYRVLKPPWDRIKARLFEFKYEVIPERRRSEQAEKRLTKEFSSAIAEYKDLMNYSFTPFEKFYDIDLAGSPQKITLSFESGRITVYRRDLQLLSNFIELLKDLPTSIFARCKYELCGKCVVVTREGKEFCPGCAAKAKQREYWLKDPKGRRERERRRYRERRKKRIGETESD